MDDNAVRNTTQRQRNNHLDLVDRISALPDFILGDILSFLSTKDAIATSILSKRCKSAWVMVRNLNFSRISSSGKQNDKKFIEFVYRVLLLHDVGLLNKFSLVFHDDPHIFLPHASSWINTAIARNIQELSLSFLIHGTFHGTFEVPSSVFSCVSLRCLELNSYCCISLSPSFVVCLPKLKYLTLKGVEFQSEEVFEKLINGCPMLNDLHLLLHRCDLMYIVVSSTSLRRLSLRCFYACDLMLDAPSLECVKLYGTHVPMGFVLTSLSSHVEVDFEISRIEFGINSIVDYIYNSIVKAINAFDCANALTLSAEAMRALSHGTVKLSTKFNRLVKLKTDIRYFDWRSLQDLIQCSDNLQVLTIHQDLNLEVIDQRNRLKWTTPVEVPRCLSKSLKKIVFDGYHGNVEDEYEMIRYMLAHGSVLEVMRITCAGKMNISKFKSVQAIGEYPRKSPLCVVKFFGSTSNNNVEVCFTARSAIDVKKYFQAFPLI